MKKICLLQLLVLLFSFIGCNSDNRIDEISESNNYHDSRRYSDFKKFSSVTNLTLQDLQRVIEKDLLSKNYSKIDLNDLDIDTTKIETTFVKNKVTGYALLMKPKRDNANGIFYNLAVVNIKGEWYKRIYKFTPSEEWLNSTNKIRYEGDLELVSSTQINKKACLAYIYQYVQDCPSGHTTLSDCGGDTSCCVKCWYWVLTIKPDVCSGGSDDNGGFDNGSGSNDGGGSGGTGAFNANVPTGETDTQNPCEKSKTPVSNLDNLLKNNTVSPKADMMKNYAQNANVEYGFTITRASATSPYVATNPYTDNNCCQVGITKPSDGSYVASGHTHSEGGSAAPSVPDLYGHLYDVANKPNYTGHFVFSHNGTTYAFVITDKLAAIDFLNNYPKSNNLDTSTNLFNRNSEMGKDFLKVHLDFSQGRAPSYSGNSQNDAIESAMAYVLEKYNAGISLAKSDANGDLKPIRAIPYEYIIPSSGGKKITAYKTEFCP